MANHHFRCTMKRLKKKEKKKVVKDKIYGFNPFASWTHFFGKVAQRRKLGASKVSRENRKELEEI